MALRRRGLDRTAAKEAELRRISRERTRAQRDARKASKQRTASRVRRTRESGGPRNTQTILPGYLTPEQQRAFDQSWRDINTRYLAADRPPGKDTSIHPSNFNLKFRRLSKKRKRVKPKPRKVLEKPPFVAKPPKGQGIKKADRVKMTPAQKAEERRLRGSRRKSMTAEQKAERAEKRRQVRAAMTPQQKADKAAARKAKRDAMSPEQKAAKAARRKARRQAKKGGA